MAIRVEITAADGSVRAIAADSGTPIAVLPGDEIAVPAIAVTAAQLEMSGDHDVMLSVDADTVTFRNLYDLLDAEIDVALALGAADGAVIVDSLAALLDRLTPDPAVAVGPDSPSFLVGGDVGSETVMVVATTEVSADPAAAGDDQIIYMAAHDAGASEFAPGYVTGPTLALADLLDLGTGPREIEILPGFSSAPVAAGMVDEFDGYLAEFAMGGEGLYKSQMSGYEEFIARHSGEVGAYRHYRPSDYGNAPSENDQSLADSGAADLEALIGDIDTIWLL
jgi:hypothetical protein